MSGAVPYGASKPVSRVLSFKTAIYLGASLPPRSSHLLNTAGPAWCVPTVLLRIEFTAMDCSQPSGRLLPLPFHPYLVGADSSRAPRRKRHGSFLSPRVSPHEGARRFLSVALFLGSPPAGVTRYPCPAEPGLSSGRTFRPLPAAAQLACCLILSYQGANVKPVFIEIRRQTRYNILADF